MCIIVVHCLGMEHIPVITLLFIGQVMNFIILDMIVQTLMQEYFILMVVWYQ